MILIKMVTNFTGFAPLGTVLVAMLGIGLAESSGLIGAALKKLVLSAPSHLLTFVIVFAGVMSNVASGVGYHVPRDEIPRYAFVLWPLSELAPEMVHPETGETFSAMWAAFDKRNQPLVPIPFRW